VVVVVEAPLVVVPPEDVDEPLTVVGDVVVWASDRPAIAPKRMATSATVTAMSHASVDRRRRLEIVRGFTE
jgi:hypothetical protein